MNSDTTHKKAQFCLIVNQLLVSHINFHILFPYFIHIDKILNFGHDCERLQSRCVFVIIDNCGKM